MSDQYKIYTSSAANETIWKYADSDKCEISNIYNGSGSVVLSALRMFLRNNPGNIWVRKKPYNDTMIPVIIMIGPQHTVQSLKCHIGHRSEGQRYIYYYWNLVDKSPVKPDAIKQLGYELWSFDPGDCEKYDMAFNPSFYFESWYQGIECNPQYDVCYVGRNKDNRATIFEKIQHELADKGFNAFAYFTAPKWYKGLGDRRYRKYLDFKKMLELELQGKAVLDIGLDNQIGPTLRVFDALCNGRKLITTNSAIKDMKLYNPRNVFIWGEDSADSLNRFIEEPFDDNQSNSYYEVSNWLNRF